MIPMEFVDSEIYHVYIRKGSKGYYYYLATNICKGHAKNNRYGPAVEFAMDKRTGQITILKQHNEVDPA